MMQPLPQTITTFSVEGMLAELKQGRQLFCDNCLQEALQIFEDSVVHQTVELRKEFADVAFWSQITNSLPIGFPSEVVTEVVSIY